MSKPMTKLEKLLGITYLVGNIKFKLLFHGPKWLSKENNETFGERTQRDDEQVANLNLNWEVMVNYKLTVNV